MKKALIIACITLCLALLASISFASGIYQWTDKNGVKHFSNTPPDIQDPVKVTREIPVTEADQSAVTPGTRGTTKRSPRNNTVELFSTSWCKYCIKAKQFLTANNIPFTEYDIEKDPAAAKRKKQHSGRASGVPYAIINGKGVYGFSPRTYANALGLD